MNYLSAENLSKSFGDKILFQNIAFGLEKGQKTALIAKNGTGKTTLLRILTGLEQPDTGLATFRKGIKVGFLDQNPQFGDSKTAFEAVLHSDNPVIKAIRNYELCMIEEDTGDKFHEALIQMDNLKAWDYEVRIKQILTKFKVGDLNKPLAEMSGGQRKRVAFAQLLIDEPDFLILDEPTNHLDLDMIEWIEEYLSNQQISLLMVTHDRYFLENVCNEIVELDNGNLYRYAGNYAYFLEKKAERQTSEASEVEKARNLMRKELDWIRKQPRARGTKAKYRIEAFQELKKTAEIDLKEKKLQMEIEGNRLGKKVMELEKLTKSYGDLKILDNFSYNFKRAEKVGVVGNNGTGKSTFLNILTGVSQPDSGEVVRGETVVFGYYTQDGIKLAEDKRVIEVIQDIAEFIPLSKGRILTASQLLEKFLFAPKTQYAYVSTLSGGERRRLYLLTILMKNPNFLILDEPTNDLDIVTLQVLEDFLEEYNGCLLLVTHDRYFMDRLVEHIFVFEGDGVVRDFNGSYSEYRAVKELEEEEAKLKASKPKNDVPSPDKSKTDKKKISYKEQKEYEALENEILTLEAEKTQITELMNTGNLSHDALKKQAEVLKNVIKTIDAKTDRWLELGELM